eukprot:scaffold45845_cov20-Tisochrysis_lutea.AAC.1
MPACSPQAAPPQACLGSYTQLGLSTAAASKVLVGVPDLAALVSLAVLWGAFAPGLSAACTSGSGSSDGSHEAAALVQWHKQDMMGRVRQLLSSASHVMPLMCVRALSSAFDVCVLSSASDVSVLASASDASVLVQHPPRVCMPVQAEYEVECKLLPCVTCRRVLFQFKGCSMRGC